jgi:hypothetical protein
MSTRWVGVFAVGVALVSVGCCRKSGTSTSSGGGSTGDAVAISNAKVQFNAPAGWAKSSSGNWTIFKPADNRARLGFVTFDKPGEATARIGEITNSLGLTAVAWPQAQAPKSIGQDHLPAMGATGTCKFASTGVPCAVTYETLSPPSGSHLLIVYAVNATGQDADLANAQAAIDSLRKM